MANDGDGTGWDSTSPANTEDAGDGAMEIRDLRLAMGIRIDKEHAQLATSSAGGEHKEGSAKAYYESSAPSNRPDGSTTLGSTDDDGRLWVDSDDKSLSVYYSGSFGLVQVVAGNLANNAVTTAKILDNNVTLAKIKDFTAGAANGRGVIIRGITDGVPQAFVVNGDAKILIGDGLDITTVNVSGDVGIDNTGLTTIQAGAVEKAMMAVANLSQITFGTYTGDGVNQAGGGKLITIDAGGWQPTFAIIFRTDSNQSCHVKTSNMSGNAAYRMATTYSSTVVSFETNGFKVYDDGGSSPNISGGTYMWMAMKEWA